MYRILVIILLVLWVCLAAFIGFNMYRQFEVSKLQMRMLNDYKLLSAVDNVFKVYRDSLAKDADLVSKRITSISRPFPLKSAPANWMLLRLAVICLTLFTIVAFWYYYKKMNPAVKQE